MRWEDVVETGPSGREQYAIGETTYRYRGVDVRVWIVKGKHGDGDIRLAGTGISLGKAPAALVDSITNWRPYHR